MPLRILRYLCQIGRHPRRYRSYIGFAQGEIKARCSLCGFEGLEDSRGRLV